MPPARCWRHDDQAPRAPHARGLAGGRALRHRRASEEEEGVHDPPVQRLQGHARGERARALRAGRAPRGEPRGGPRTRDVPEVQGAAAPRAALGQARALLPRARRQARRLHHEGEADRVVQGAEGRRRARASVRARRDLPAEEAGVRRRAARRPPGGPRARAVARVPGRLRDQAVLRHVRGLERGAGDLGRQLRVPGRQRRAHQRRRAQGCRIGRFTP